MIYIECRPDETLVKAITNFPGRGISHAGIKKYAGGGRSRVLNKPRNCRNSKGMIDEDPLGTPHPYMRVLRLEKDFSERGLKLWHDVSRDNYLV